jgi:secreted trypsin-like serine protease
MRPLLAATLLVLALAAPPAARASIVGGQETDREWPFMVYLENGRQELELGDTQFCGGSLVAPTWVLTAAHCLTTLEVSEPGMLVAVNGRRVKSDRSAGRRIQAKRVIRHPKYGSINGSDHDVMLVELGAAAPGAPIRIAGPGEEPLWPAGALATILGWGATAEGGSGSDALKEAQVPLISDADCARDYQGKGDIDPATMLCAGYPEGGTDTCQGDSGGPLIVPASGGGWRQVGVTSWGEGCARPGLPGVYAEAAGTELRGWIAGIVPEAIAPAVSSATASQAPAGSAAPSATKKKTTKKAAKKRGRCLKYKRKRGSKKRVCVKRAKKRAAARRH